ncbi:hypothetical protein Tco_1550043 [Tanacetum coccineum]
MICNQNLLYDTKILEGSTLYCKAHGGGKRCVFADCTKGAEGSTPLCKAHGGGKRCLHDGGGICPKSVHGGTNCCVARGGGKMCTDCCVKHGGGKRCKSENCTKSAQGSTEFCKAHDAHTSMLQEREASVNKESNLGIGIGPGLFHGLVPGLASTIISSFDNTYSSSAMSIVSDSDDSLEKPGKRQQLIPPQVFVPPSMNFSFSSPSSRKSSEFVVPEG